MYKRQAPGRFLWRPLRPPPPTEMAVTPPSYRHRRCTAAGGTAPRVFVSTLVPARDPPRGGTAGQRHWPPLCSPPCSRARPAAWASLATLAVLRAECFAACSVRALGSRELGARRLVQGARCQARAQFARSACCVAADSVRALGSRGLGTRCSRLGQCHWSPPCSPTCSRTHTAA